MQARGSNLSYYGEEKITTAIQRLKAEGHTNQEIGDIIGVGEHQVRRYADGTEPGFSKGLKLLEYVGCKIIGDDDE